MTDQRHSKRADSIPALDVPAGSAEVLCDACKGEGYQGNFVPAERIKCCRCDGTGWRSVGWGNMIPCPACSSSPNIRSLP